jgi:MFS family permease
MLPSNRNRAIIGFLVMFFGQTTRTVVINNYGPSIYAGINVDTPKHLILTASWVTSGVLFNYICASLMDRIGRVSLVVIGFLGEVCVLLVMYVLPTGYKRTARPAGFSDVVFLIFAHMSFY